jgi:hypothetical protein
MTGKQLPREDIVGDRGGAHVHYCVLDSGLSSLVLHEGHIGSRIQEMHCNDVA